MKLASPPLAPARVRRALFVTIALGLFVPLTSLTSHDARAADDDSEDDADPPVFVLNNRASLDRVGQGLVKRVPSAAELEATSDAAWLGHARTSQAVLAELHDVLSMSPSDVLTAPDPKLALETFRWATEFASQYTDAIANNASLVDGIRGPAFELEPSSSDPKSGDFGRQSRFEGRLGGLMSSLSGLMQETGSEESDPWYDDPPETGSGDAWTDYLNDQAPPGDNPDHNDADVDGSSEESDWQTYLNEQSSVGDSPDLPDYDEDEDDGEDTDGDTVIVDTLDKEGDDEVWVESSEDGPTILWIDESEDEDQIPCDPTVDGCNSGGGPPPEHDDDDGTTQPGLDQKERGELPAVPDPGDPGPLILVDPEQSRAAPVVVVVRSPGYGLTQPPPDSFESPAMWRQDPGEIESAINGLFEAARDQAAVISDLCGRPGCEH